MRRIEKTKRAGTRKVPSYLQHRPSGRAYCWVYAEDGARRALYLGRYDSPESYRRFAEVRECCLRGLAVPESTRSIEAAPRGMLTIEQLVARFLRWAEQNYVKDGKPTGEVRNLIDASRQLLRLFREELGAAFGPRKLKEVREEMIADGLSRRVINDRVHRIRRMFRWAAEDELLPHSVWQSLRTVTALRYGRSAAHETAPVEPCTDNQVRAVLPHLGSVVATMVQVQLLTGCRPHEVCEMRASDMDFSGRRGCWVWSPRRHKTQHQGRARKIAIGPRAQELLGPFLRADGGFLFSPAESERERRLARRAARETKVQPSQVRRAEAAAARGGRAFSDHYEVAPYRRAIHRACKEAGIERWSPQQLRHRRCVEVEREMGPEAARSVLGHSSIVVTAHYAHLDEERAIDVMREIG